MVDILSLCLLTILTTIGIINLVWKATDRKNVKS